MSRIDRATPSLRARAPGKVRIIGGSLRGSVVSVPDLPGLRPTPNRVRETLFNWLQQRMTGARALDLCAGSGALGIEALSRGAAHCTFVEAHAAAAAGIQSELKRLKVDAHALVCTQPVESALTQLAGPFDVVFLDPPFALNLWDSCLSAMLMRPLPLLAPSALVYVESPVSWTAPSNWRAHRLQRAGDVQFGLYTPAGA